MTVTTTAPAVTFTAVRASAERNLRAEHVIEDVEHGHLLVVLSSSHDKDRKQFTARLTRMTRVDIPGSPFQSERYRPMEDTAVVFHDVTTRYSDKALAAFHADALATVTALVNEAHPKVIDLLRTADLPGVGDYK